MSIGGYEDYILKGSPKYFETIEGRSLGRNTLDFIHLNLPLICNYNCAKCSTKSGSKKLEETLTLEEIKELLARGKDLGALALAISGEGEPLMYKPFLDILEYAYTLGLVSIIATNGSLLDENKIQFLYEHDVTLTISLDTLDRNKYEEQCRIKGKFDSVLKNIDLVSKIYREDIEERNGFRVYRAGIHTIVNSENFGELSNLRDYCGDRLFFSVGYIANHGNAIKNLHLLDNYERVKNEAEQQGEAFLLCQSKNGLPVCGFFYYGLTVGYNGEVLLADHALETAGLIGNIRNESLANLKKKTSTMIDSFYKTDGSCYCIVRDPHYKEFVRRCKNDK